MIIPAESFGVVGGPSVHAVERRRRHTAVLGLVAAAASVGIGNGALGFSPPATVRATSRIRPSPCPLRASSARRNRHPRSSGRDRDRGDTSLSAAAGEGRSSAPTSQPPAYVRIRKRGRNFDVQTAVTTFTFRAHAADSTTTTVDLHAQIHFGDASYFDYYNDDAAFGSKYDGVLYELIVEGKMLSPAAAAIDTSPSSSVGAPPLRILTPVRAPGGRLENPVAPSLADRNTASQYGLQCQVDAVDYCREGWIHADLTREEFLVRMECGSSQHLLEDEARTRSKDRPLWALASTAPSYPGSEVFAALVRPVTASDAGSASAGVARRLFSNLFLPGDALAGWIRAALWCGVPSPELSVMLVDWSSLSHLGKRRGGENNGGNYGVGPISPIAAPVFLSLLTGNWGAARRLVFGQVLAAGARSSGADSGGDDSKNGVLIDARNERAMEVLRKVSTDGKGNGGGTNRVALLYGAAHCRDLHRRLVVNGSLTPVRTEWRTAFRTTAPRWGDYFPAAATPIGDGPFGGRDADGLVSASALESVAVGLVVLPLYLLVGGLDWVSTLGDLGSALDGGAYADGLAALALYLLRHVALYVGISKFVVDWDGGSGVFEDEDGL